MQDPGNFQYLDLRWGLTFAFGATDESKSQPTPTPKPQMSQTVTPTPAQTAVEPTMTETPTPTPIALEEKPIVKATVNSGPVTAIAAVKKYYRTGMKAFIAGHYQTALKLLTKSLAVKEAHMAYYYYAETYATIGVIYHFHSKVSNHKALAKKYYQKALKIDPTTKSAKKYLRMLTVKPTPTPSDTQAQ
jgi:TPR repeat protein